MLNRNLRIAFAAIIVTAMSACGSSPMGPEEEQAVAPPSFRTACMAGGEVARRAGCPEDTWSDSGDPFDPWEEDLSPREKWPN